VSWTGISGDLWLFGGIGKAAREFGGLNDLWKYNPGSAQWTWMSGDTTINSKPVYGTKGIALPANGPGYRSKTASWTDASGNLWLFSGNYSDDMWKYSPLTGQWTWVHGDTAMYVRPVYGSKGIAAPGNTPGARQVAFSWTDPLGNFWLYGGGSYSPFTLRTNKDVWKFVPSINQWAWMGGDTTAGATNVYGTKGVASSNNIPPFRSNATSWVDKAGDFWLFGGLGPVVSIAPIYNDLWKYSIATDQWTWVSGDSTLRNPGVYGTKGVAAASNKPPARFSATGTTDSSGNLWLIGGNSLTNSENLNDLWKFMPSTGQWTWMNGDSTRESLGYYGIQGESGPLNKPAARRSATTWTDNNGSIWLFGGEKNNHLRQYYGDLWRYSVGAAPLILPVQFISFTARKQSTTVLLNWKTFQERNISHYVVERSSSAVRFDSIGSVATGISNFLPVDYAFTDPAPLKGINHYRLKSADRDGRINYSSVQTVVMEDDVRFVLMQNPVQQTLRITAVLPADGKLTIQVRDVAGHLLINRAEPGRKGSSLYSIPVGHLATGNYLITMQAGDTRITKSFIRVK
jgi:hypothetical protein